MATSDPGQNRPFVFSRKNVTGVIVAALVIVVHLIYGLGFLWPVVTVAAWGAAVLLVPDERRPALGVGHPGMPRPEQLDADLTETTRRLWAARPPREIQDEAAKLRDSLQWLLKAWHKLEDVPEQRIMIATMVQEFLPGLVDSYLNFPDPDHPKAVSGIVESMQILREEAEQAKKAVIEDNVRQLADHTRALRLQFGRMPGLQSSDDPSAG